MIGWERVRELRGELGDEVFAEVVALFFEEAESVLATMQGPAPPHPERELHFLKGGAINLGFEWLRDLCAAGEAQARSGSLQRADIEMLVQAYHDSRAAFLAGLGNRIRT